MWCYYGSMGESGYHFIVPTSEHIDAAIRNHVRLWRQSRMWKAYPEDLARFDREYYGTLKRHPQSVP
jgi:glycogen synthase